MKKTMIAAALALLAQAGAAADLLQSWRAAQQYDATYQAARHALDAGREKNNQARALWLPKVTLDGSAQKSREQYHAGSETLPDSSANGEQYSAAVSAAQPIYRADVMVGSDQLRKQADLAEVQFRDAEQLLILRTAQAYFEVLAAQERVQLAVSQKEAISQQLAQARKSFEVGVATITDTNEAQARYDAILASEIAARNDLEIKHNAFQLLTGLDPAALATISEDLRPTGPQPAALESWVERAQNENLAVRSQGLNLDISRREIDRYRVSTAPTLDLVAKYGNTWASEELSRSGGRDRTENTTIGLQLSIPLYTGGERSSKYREAIANRDRESLTLEAAKRDSVKQVKQAFLGVQSGAAQIEALEQAQKSSLSSLESTKLGREVGVRTTVDVLDAEQKYYQTRYDLVVARYQYLYARLQLAYAVGDLDEADLLEVNEWLQ
ncbi:TolC family outer membrane protein [Chitiniphilus purpureus]|uniref:TolC family outer membrane protein n=1 Tax=Chitiniphilus purpureus TaxID=2981137 RepID=A0ABY6DRY1_9NEIS|nr:TolC family outer membrane protein [Chitiniphilus sp. CD1]UXY16226.1 TolC family outer membrane protein [Chitiniphilus sp. CD1]